MTESTTATTTFDRNPAVMRCCEVRLRAIREGLDRGAKDFRAEHEGDKAYRAALPDPIDAQSIRDFIACIIYGMILGVFEAAEGTKLLYGAQVAVVALGREAKEKKPSLPPPPSSQR